MSANIKDKAVKGVSWSFADNIINQGITFLVGLILARLLTPGEFGLIGIIAIFIAIFNTIIDSGFSNALIRKTDAKDLDYNTVFITNMVLSIVLFFALFYLAPLISVFFNQSLLLPLTRVMGIIVIINAFALIQRTILVKNVDFKTQAKISLIASITSGGIGITMAVVGYGVWSIVAQQISRQFLNTVFLWTWAKWYPKLQFSLCSFKELFGFGWKLLVSSLIDTIWKEIYQVVIGKCYSAEILGQYTRAHQFSSIFSSNLTTVVHRVSYPVLSEIQGNKDRLKYVYKRIIRVTMFITFCCMLGMAAIAKPMILTLVGERWLPAVPFLQIMCLYMIFYPLHAINLNMLQIQGRSDLFLKLEVIKKIVSLLPIVMGIYINIYWMLWGTVLTALFSYYLNSYYSGKFLGYSISEQIKDILPSFIIGLIMSLVVFLLSFLNISHVAILLIQLIIGLAILLILCELTRLKPYIELKNIILPFINKN